MWVLDFEAKSAKYPFSLPTVRMSLTLSSLDLHNIR